MPISTSDPATEIRAKAVELGFDAAGITRPEAVTAAGADLRRFLAEGRQGEMDWLDAKADRRADPRVLWPEVRSIVVVAQNYAAADPGGAALYPSDRAAISLYARRRDYHDVMKKRLKRLGRWLQETHGGELKVFVDTAPVMEKPLAQAAGLGWQGKHTNLVSRDFGSWLFLGALFTTLDLAPDTPAADACGSCRDCLDACPTDALATAYRIDARRCVSYLTIEHKTAVDPDLRAAMGNWVFGCDACLSVCPWNKFSAAGTDPKLAPFDRLVNLKLADLARLDDTAFRALFAGTPVKRTGQARFRRNVAIALGNSGGADAVDRLAELLTDPSPLVRGAAVWGLAQRLGPAPLHDLHDRFGADEEDADVRAEWDAAAHQ